MKNRNSIRRVEKIGEKILRPPSLNVKGSRPQSKKENRKFGDNLTNLSIFQECKEEEFREKNVLVQKVKGTNKRA